MDVRKRPFSELEGDTADDATKRSASVNDMSNLSMGSEIAIVQPEVEAFRKEAIWRRMQEYKREAEGLGERLEQLEKSGKYHDEHIRLIDAWFSQFLEELKLPNTTQLPQLPLSQLFSGDPDSLRDHLSKFKESVLQAARSFASSPHLTLSSSEQETQNALSEVSSKVRLLQASNDVLQVEKEKRDQRLADLSFQLLALEKQEDRRKSLTLAKIAESAIQKSEGTSTADTAAQIAAPEKKHDPIDVEATKIEYETKHATLQTEIQQLTETYLQTQKELTDCRVKLEDPPLSTVERSSAYSQLNAQLSNLRPLLVKLQQANDELLQNQADSDISLTAAKIEFEKEQNFSLDQLRGQLAAAETDVTRLRSARDEIFQELQIKKTKEEKKFDTIKELADLAESRELRIKALESEIERFRPSANGTVSNDDNINLSTDELRQKFSKLEEQYKRLSAELPGVEAAFNKVHKISSAKVFDAVAFEERHTRILAEKGKADQKYFAAMKTKDMLSAEVKVLKQQISRSSEIITKLQEADNLSQKKLHALEKESTSLESKRQKHETEISHLRGRTAELQISVDSLQSQFKILDSESSRSISQLQKETQARISAESEVSGLTAKLQTIMGRKNIRSLEDDNEQMEVYRNMTKCSVCRRRWKNTVLVLCGHVLCRECVDARIETRQRACPVCARKFGANDMLSIHL